MYNRVIKLALGFNQNIGNDVVEIFGFDEDLC